MRLCSKSAALLEKMATSGADVISLDWTVRVRFRQNYKLTGSGHNALSGGYIRRLE
jgi:uroporphyrinogen-III decarboxylase